MSSAEYQGGESRQAALEQVLAFFKVAPGNSVEKHHKTLLDIRNSSTLIKQAELFSPRNRQLLERLKLYQAFRDLILITDVSAETDKAISILRLLQADHIHDWVVSGLKIYDWPEHIIDLSHFHRLLAHFDTISPHFSMEEILYLFSLLEWIKTTDKGNPANYEEIQRLLEKAPVVLKPIMDVLRIYRNPYLIPWPERIKVFNQLREHFGAGSLVTDQDISNAVVSWWQPSEAELRQLLPAEAAQPTPTKADLAKLPTSAQMEVLSRLRNGISRSQTSIVRSAVKNRLAPSHIESREAEEQKVLQAIALFENDLHPFTLVTPNMGYEIESHYPFSIYDLSREDAQLKLLLTNLDLIGLHMGNGDNEAPVEIAHGPYKSVVTAKKLFSDWVDAQWLDLHRHRMQTCHMNVQINKPSSLRALNQLTILSAYVYHPQTRRDKSNSYYVLREKMSKKSNQNGEMFSETKGFYLVNHRDFIKHLEEYGLLAAAAVAADQVIAVALRKGIPTKYTDRDAWQRIKTVSPYIIELAQIWAGAMVEFNELLDAFGLAAEPEQDVPTNHQIQAIHQVFELPEDHWDDDVLLSPKNGQPSELNVIAATRQLTARTSKAIESVMMQMQAEFVEYLQAMANAHGQERSRTSHHFFTRFPEYQKKGTLHILIRDLLPLFQPFLEPGSTLPRPV